MMRTPLLMNFKVSIIFKIIIAIIIFKIIFHLAIQKKIQMIIVFLTITTSNLLKIKLLNLSNNITNSDQELNNSGKLNNTKMSKDN